MSTPIIEIPFESPNYPLPHDYESLTQEGRRQARVNACRQWRIRGTPAEKGRRLVGSLEYFDFYYLVPSGDFNPMFYEDLDGPLPTPDMHYRISYMWGAYDSSLCIMPRGSGKSTHTRKDILLRLCSAMYNMVYATSTNENTETTGSIVRDQLYENSRINDDFCPEYDIDAMKPQRGAKKTGVHHFYTRHGSWLRCVSAESKIRGIRTLRFRLDDPEYDEKGATSMALIREYMERLVFKIAMPMVFRRNSGLDWTATYVSRRHYAWAAMQVMANGRAEDERFDYWARYHVKAVTEDENGRMISCWPHMWPADDAERDRLQIPDAKTLVEIRGRIGNRAFQSEFQGNPGVADDAFFTLDLAPRGKHAYWIEGAHPDPWRCEATMNYLNRKGELTSVPLPEFLDNVRMFTTVDTAYTEGPTSDRRCCTLMGVTPENELFVLDMWSARKRDTILMNRTFEMAKRWGCRAIHIETVKESYKLLHRFQHAVRTRMAEEMGYANINIRPLKIGTTPKPQKIETLDTRIEQGLLKLPLQLRGSKPWWGRLIDQILEFNPEANNGGLQHDDEIDTVAMSTMIIKGRLRRAEEPEEIDPQDVMAARLSGRTTHPDGTPLIMDPSLLPEGALHQLLSGKIASRKGSRV